jgi:anti-anti-sigma factor
LNREDNMKEDNSYAIESMVARAEHQPDTGILCVTFSDQLSSARLRDFRDFFREEFERGHYKLVLNLEKVDIILSAHIGILWSQRQIALQHGGDLKFVGLSKMIYAAFDAISLITFIDIFDTVEEAIEAFGRNGGRE